MTLEPPPPAPRRVLTAGVPPPAGLATCGCVYRACAAASSAAGHAGICSPGGGEYPACLARSRRAGRRPGFGLSTCVLWLERARVAPALVPALGHHCSCRSGSEAAVPPVSEDRVDLGCAARPLSRQWLREDVVRGAQSCSVGFPDTHR